MSTRFTLVESPRRGANIWVMGTDLRADQTMGAGRDHGSQSERWRVFLFFFCLGFPNWLRPYKYSPAQALPFDRHILVIVQWMSSTTAYS